MEQTKLVSALSCVLVALMLQFCSGQLPNNELDVDVGSTATPSTQPPTTSTMRVTTSRRYVKPGPKCYHCVKNCTKDWTGDVLRTCTADQICVRKMATVIDELGNAVVERSSGCTYECKVGYLVSTSLNMSTRCCSSFEDKACSIPEYSAGAIRWPMTSWLSSPLTVLLVFLTAGGLFF